MINRHLPNLIDVLDEDEDEDNLGIIDPTLGGINKLRHNQEESNCEYGSGLEETGELESSGSEYGSVIEALRVTSYTNILLGEEITEPVDETARH